MAIGVKCRILNSQLSFDQDMETNSKVIIRIQIKCPAEKDKLLRDLLSHLIKSVLSPSFTIHKTNISAPALAVAHLPLHP